MKKLLILALVVIIAAGAGIYFYSKRTLPATYRTAKVERGTIVASVSATGSLAAVKTVQVGTQVSGTIQKLFVDFNSTVKKGQAIAQIDPSLFTAQVEQNQGNHASAQANLQKARATMEDAGRTLERNRQLVKEGIIAQSDFDAADTKYREAAAAVRAAEGTLLQTRGAYTQARTNLKYATIKSPVDGTVVSRNVDVGQTVAASFQTPTLFTIAQDLTKMEIDTSVDEADISRIKQGQPATFTVDAYPEERFRGRVMQIRNAPVVTQNVVTYVVVVGVDNKDLKLKPGMTANVAIETARKDDILKIPSAALRFKPKSDKERKESGSRKGGGGGATPGAGTGSVSSPSGRRMVKEISQQVYLLDKENKPVPVTVATGISNDGQVELLKGDLKENDEVIVEQIMPKKKTGGAGGSPMGPRF